MLYVGNQKYASIISNTKADFHSNPLYDAELEYLENTATSCIDTGFKPNQNTRIIADMQTVTSTSYGRLFGCVSGTTYNTPPCFAIDYETGATGNFHVMWGSKSSWTTISSVTGNYNRHIYEVNKGVIYRDDTQIYEFPSELFQLPTNLAIFSYTKSNGITTDTNEYLKGRLYSFKIYDNDVLVLDLIPVRINQEGCMYDKINKKLFRNAGTGQFVLGPDKQEE